MSDQILMSRAAGVCEVRLNRPEKRNAITFAMYEALYRGLREAQEDAAVRVVLLAGEGAGFCAGNDLNDFLTGPPFSAEHPVMGFLHTLATFEKPLLAAVHGQTVGIGVTLLLRGDPRQVQARIEAEARIFATQLQSEEFRVAVRALLAKGRAG